MKVGTDAVLLGAWCDLADAKSILDIGTGSGIIALMTAQRSRRDALIDAVEILQNDAEQATQNVKDSPWPTKVRGNLRPNPGLHFRQWLRSDCLQPTIFLEEPAATGFKPNHRQA